MKRVIYTGLLALSIAFGVTSCDKNDIESQDVKLTKADAKDNNFIHTVKIGETGLFAVPKGKSDAASKNAADFANSHVYASTPQSLIIVDQGTTDVQYTGSYTAGLISSLDPSDIILGNGSYTAMSTNASSDDESLVTGFASYSAMVDFDLSASGNITLAVTHDRGFIIADSERADGGARITSVVLSSGEGDAALSGSLILDADADTGYNDFYGYLLPGTYSVVINYLLDGSEASVSAEGIVIAEGVASTLAPMLTAEPSASSETTTSTQSINEAALAGDDLAAYSNNDEDFLDSISRVVSSTITTTSGEAGEPVIENGAWSVDSNIDISISAGIVTSTEDALGTDVDADGVLVGRDINGDGDMLDGVTRTVTTTTIITDTVAGTPDLDESPWVVLLAQNRNLLGADENPDLGDTPPVVYVDREYSVYGPAYADNTENFVQTREVSNSADAESFDPDVAEESLSRNVVVTSEITLAAIVGTAGVLTYTAVSGDVAIGTHDVVIPALEPAPIVARTYSVWGPAYADNIADFSQSRTVTNDGAFNDPDVAVEALTRAVVAVYSVTTAPEAGVIGVGTWTSMAGTVLVGTHNVDIAALPAESTDLVRADFTEDLSNNTWTAASGEQFRIGSVTTPSAGFYFQIWDGSAYGDASELSLGTSDDAYFMSVDAAIVAINANN